MKNKNALSTILVAAIVFLAACSPQTNSHPRGHDGQTQPKI